MVTLCSDGDYFAVYVDGKLVWQDNGYIRPRDLLRLVGVKFEEIDVDYIEKDGYPVNLSEVRRLV